MSPQRITLTPELARTLLTSSTAKQEINFSQVASLVSLILNGGWVADMSRHSPVETFASGEMYNGHHRCLAVVISDTEIDTYLHVHLAT